MYDVRVKPADSSHPVTSTRETSARRPEDVLPRACQVIEDGRQVGLHVGAQAFVSLHGQTVADFGRGEARPSVPMTADSIVLWLSAGKPITAAAILQLVERGLVALDAPVAHYIPEFAVHGKQVITVRQLLTHTGGFRWLPLEGTEPWDEIIARVAATKLERGWIPGAKAGYHAYTSWFMLGEIIQRTDGRKFTNYVRQQIFLPLAMVDSWIGMPMEQYTAYGDRMAVTVHTDKLPPYPHRFASAAGAALVLPGANAHGPVHDLGRFYGMLLGGGELDGADLIG